MIRLLLLLGTFVFVCLTPWKSEAAAPQLYKTCPGIAPISNQGLLLFDQECTSGFLLPSSRGQLNVTGAFIKISDETCAAVQAMEKSALGTFGDANERAAKRLELETSLHNIQAAETAQAADLDTYNEAKTSIDTQLTALQTQYAEAQKYFKETCSNDPQKSFQCLALADNVTKLKAKIDDLANKKLRLDALITSITQKIAAMQTQETSLNQSIAALAPSAAPNDLQQQARDQLVTLSREQGAVISASLRTTLIDDLQRLRTANPNTKISLDQMRFSGGSIFAAGIDRQGVPEANGSATLEVPGLPVDGGGTLFVNASGAKLTLDVVSACQAFNYKKPDPQNLGAISKNLAANIVAKAYLRYKALIGAKINVHLDYTKFYSLLVQTKSNNGFFRTSTIKDITENLSAQQSLTVTIVDENNVLSADAKDALQNAMRNRVIQRALDLLNAKYVGIDQSAAPAAPQAGAPVLSAALRKCANVWCQAGAVVIDVANAIFGGSESTQSFVQNLGVKVDETYSDQEAFEFATDLAFVPMQ